MVKAADRLVMHVHYVNCPGLYTHQRLVEVVQPYGPLSKGKGDALQELLRFFKGLPEELFQDVIHGFSHNPDNTEDREAIWVHVHDHGRMENLGTAVCAVGTGLLLLL